MATRPTRGTASGGGGGRRIIAVTSGAAAIIVVALAWQRYAQRPPTPPTASPAAPATATGAIARTVPSPTPLQVAPFDTALILAAMDDTYPAGAAQQTALLIRALPPRMVFPGGPIPELISAQYGLTAASHPETYALLESEIRRLNPVQPAGDASRMLVPAVPHATTAAPNMSRRYDVTVRPQVLDGGAPRLVSDVEMVTLAAQGPPLRSVMRIRVPVAQLTTPAMSDLIGAPENTLVSFPLSVAFARSNDWTSSRRYGPGSRPANWSCISSRSSTSLPARSSAGRRWSGGTIPSGASSRQCCSCRSPRSPG